jgi:hypothetical protein
MGQWLVNHFRHELHRIATSRWPRGTQWPELPGFFYGIKPNEIACIAAQTARVGHITGWGEEDWATLKEPNFMTMEKIRLLLADIGRHDLQVPRGSGTRYVAIFERMHAWHRAHLMRNFPTIHGQGIVRTLELFGMQHYREA